MRWGETSGRVRLRVLDPAKPRAAHHLGEGGAVVRDLSEHPFDDQLTGIRHVGRDGVSAVQDYPFQPAQVVGGEGHGRRHHEVQQDAHGPYVHVLADVAFLSEELGGRVWRRATECAEGLSGARHGAEAKVAHFDAVARGVEYVFCFQVPVHDVDVMLWTQNMRGRLKVGYPL